MIPLYQRISGIIFKFCFLESYLPGEATKHPYFGNFTHRRHTLIAQNHQTSVRLHHCRCLQPFGIHVAIQSWIFCLHLMYLLFERCITGLILVSYPTVVLCVSLCTHSTILFSLLFCYLLSFAVLRSFNHLSFIVTLLSSYLLGTKFLYYISLIFVACLNLLTIARTCLFATYGFVS